MKMPCRHRCLMLALLCLIQTTTAKAELYKYTNEDGVTVLDSHVPARYVKNGYTILSLDGRILEVVPRALSDQEIRNRDRLLAEQERKDRERREREIADQNLMRIYGAPDDVIRARNAKISSIDSMIETQRGNIQRLGSQQRQLESALADLERAGETISQDRLTRIRTIENRIGQIESEIDHKLEEREGLNVSYDKDLARVKELYGR
jgi:hypothetical protein